jgi:predicted PurR-regulated permease PerM
MAKSSSQPPSSSPSADRHLWQLTPVRDAMILGGILVLMWVVYVLRSIFLPVLIGLVLAYLLAPVISYAHVHWRFPRPLTISLLLILLVTFVVGGIVTLGPLVMDQLVTLSHNLPEYVSEFADRYKINLGSLTKQLKQFANYVKEHPFDTVRSLFSGTSRAFGFVEDVIGAVTGMVLFIALVPLYFFFFALRLPYMVSTAKDYLPSRHKDRIEGILNQMDLAMSSFFRGRLMIAFCMAFMLAGGWYFAEVPYWFLLGVGTGILSIIPYAATIGWPIAVVLKYLDMAMGQGIDSSDWLSIVFWPSAVYGIVQLFEGWVLTPWIQSQSTDLHAMTILLVVLIGGVVAGVYGLLFAIPITLCVKILFRDLFLPELKAWTREPESSP